MTTGEKTSTRRWLVVWFVLSIVLVLVGLWRLRGFTGGDGVGPSRLELSDGDGGHRLGSQRTIGPGATGPAAIGPEVTNPTLGSQTLGSQRVTGPALGSQTLGSQTQGKREVAKNYQEALRNRQLGRLDERWREEEWGESWTRETARWLDDEFKRREIPGRLEQSDCRQSLCKLRVVFDDLNDAGKIYAVNLDPTTNWYTDFRVVGKQMVVTAYLGAPGEDLRRIMNDPFTR